MTPPVAAARRPRARSRATTRRSSTSSVRLNTNESPYPPPPEFVDRWLDELARARRSTAIPTAPRTDLRAALGASPRPAGRAAVLRQRLQRGAADAAAHLRRPRAARRGVRAHVRAARAHRPHHRHRGGRRASGAPTSRSTPTPRRALIARAAPDDRVRVQPQQPHRHGRAGRHHRGAARRRPTASSSSTRRTASSRRWSALELVRDDAPLVVVRTYSKVWSLAALRLGFAVAPPWVVERAREGRAAVPPRVGHADRGHGSRSSSATRWTTGSQRLVAERERVVAALDEHRRRHRVPVGRELRAVPRRTATATRSGRRWSSAACSCATSRAGPGSRTACVSPSARPRRTTRSSPRSASVLREVAA